MNLFLFTIENKSKNYCFNIIKNENICHKLTLLHAIDFNNVVKKCFYI